MLPRLFRRLHKHSFLHSEQMGTNKYRVLDEIRGELIFINPGRWSIFRFVRYAASPSFRS